LDKIQCEVVQREMLGAGPQDEDPIPAQLQIDGQLPIDFFGLGQQVMGQQDEQPQQQILGPIGNALNNVDAVDWQVWPEELPATQMGQ
jgi:hypothetical protein